MKQTAFRTEREREREREREKERERKESVYHVQNIQYLNLFNKYIKCNV